MLEKECELQLMQEAMKKRESDLEAESFALEQERKRLQTASSQLTEQERKRHAQREADIEAKLEQLKKELSDARSQRDLLDERLLDVYAENVAANHDKEHLNNNIAELVAALATAKQEHAEEVALNEVEHQAAMQEATRQQEALKKQHNEEIEQLKALHQQVLDALQKQHQTQCTDLNQKNDEKVRRLQKDVESREADLESARRSHATVDEELAEQRQLFAAERSAKAREIADLKAELERRCREQEAAAEKAEQQNTTMKALDSELKRMAQRAFDSDSKCTEQATALAKCRAEIVELTKLLESHTASFQTEVASLKEANATLQADTTTKVQVILKLKESQEESAQRCNGLQENLATAKGQLVSLQDELQASMAAIQKKEEELFKVNAELTSLRAEANDAFFAPGGAASLPGKSPRGGAAARRLFGEEQVQ